jgi:hypothetical protein
MTLALGIMTVIYIPYSTDTMPKWGSILVIVAMMIYVSGYQVGHRSILSVVATGWID